MALYDTTPGAVSTVMASALSYYPRAAQLADDKIVVIYTRSTTLYAIVGTLSGTTWTWGTEVTISATAGSNDYDVCKAANDKFAVIYTKNATGRPATKICTVSGTTITVGAEVELSTTGCSVVLIRYVSDDKIFTLFGSDSTNSDNWVRCATISGTTATYGTAVVCFTGYKTVKDYVVMGLINTDKIAAHMYNPVGYDRVVRIFTISGTAITAGTNNRYAYLGYPYARWFMTPAGTDKFVVGYTWNSTQISYIEFTVSGTDATAGSGITMTGVIYSEGFGKIEKGLADNEIVFIYRDSSKIYVFAGKHVGGTLTQGGQDDLNGGATATPGSLIPVNLSSPGAMRYAAIFFGASNYCYAQIIDADFNSVTFIPKINFIT